jgi:hypothetical protein
MNTEYGWWAIIAILTGAGAVAYLALGPVPEIGGEAPEPGTLDSLPDEKRGPGPDDEGPPPAPLQNPPVSTTVPGPEEPASTRETP